MPYLAALLGMELRGEEVVLLHRCAERVNVMGDGCRFFADGHIEAVDEIDERSPLPAPPLGECFEKRGSDCSRSTPTKGERRGGYYFISPHMRYLFLVPEGHKALHLGIENAQTIHIALFRMAAHQLLADADAENGLL